MPWVIPLISAGVGIYQTVAAGQRAKKEREKIESMKPPTAESDSSVSRYYNEALRRYNTAPTSTAQYKNAMFNINRNLNQGLSALKDRRSLIGGVSSLVGRSNDASVGAAASAEREQANRFGVLGGASQAKTRDNRFLFGQNELAPYQQQLTLSGMKAAANANTMNTGIQNIFSGLQNYAMMTDGTFKPPKADAASSQPTSYYNLVTDPYGRYTGN